MLQTHYWMTSRVQPDSRHEQDAVESRYHMSFTEAHLFAVSNGCETIELHEVSKDTVARLYNGDGGWVISSKVVWTTPSKL